jgi:hypothetical protein
MCECIYFNKTYETRLDINRNTKLWYIYIYICKQKKNTYRQGLDQGVFHLLDGDHLSLETEERPRNVQTNDNAVSLVHEKDLCVGVGVSLVCCVCVVSYFFVVVRIHNKEDLMCKDFEWEIYMCVCVIYF